MTNRPYVLLSCAASLDGYIDDNTSERLLLSNDADFDRVDEVRAQCDAILVGASTIRRDNPRLLVRSEARRASRLERGLTETPTKATITRNGDLSSDAQFFAAGETDKVVYATSSGFDKTQQAVGAVADVVDAGDPVNFELVLADLARRGIGRLMVEGGGSMHTEFLTTGLADELHLVVAPFFVGDSAAPRFVKDGAFPWNKDHRARLASATQIQDVILLRYALSNRFQD
ncbi:dihydrofolate reductase family protein [Nocardia sp. XZ_19_385]|uniref:RibD family protein n=1 Tax=Nocardia sp. XZ_19_385 TaxID=2769488 RepID=UPI001890A3AF|nr:dihydrofolate reductase family protein [Nocardia sp. XZ_19_385]